MIESLTRAEYNALRRRGMIQRLIVNLPPRHLKSLIASTAFPDWVLGHNPSAQILRVSYAQDVADKLAHDCRGIMTSAWYQRIFPTGSVPLAPSGAPIRYADRARGGRAGPPVASS